MEQKTPDNGERQKLAASAPSKCPYCQRHFHTPDDLTLHIVTKHAMKGKGTAPLSSKRQS